MPVPVPDTPASIDELGFDRFAVPFARTIAATDRSTTPWTIGVYGEWGSGKTTFLKLVEKELARSGVRPIWFNAWKYARDDDLWAALIEKIVVEARRSVPWYRAPDVRLRIWLRSIDFGAGFFELFRKLLAIAFKVVALAGLILMAVSLVPVAGNPVTGWLAGNAVLGSPWIRALVGVVAALGTKPEALLKLFDVKLGADLGAFRRSRAHRSQAALVDDFTAEFQGVLEVVYRKNPLVVIIDDLDRCLPEQTLQIIETVKLVLDEPGCVFLLAVDREVIEHAIRVKYKDLPSVAELGETFFEKIVQLPYSLPPPAEGRVESYIRSISSDPQVLECLPILRGTAPYNPRRIKRSVQAFTMLRELSADLEPVPSVLAKLVVIQAQFRQVYRAAVNDRALLSQLEQVYRESELAIDDVLRARAERFAEVYPGLKALFCLRLGDQDSFSETAAEALLSIVDQVVVREEPEQVPAKRTILVSCMSTDHYWGVQLERMLQDAGEDVLVVKPGRPIPVSYQFVIGVLSQNSSGSPAAEHLWMDAVAKGIPFLAVRVDNAWPSKFLQDKDTLDLVGKGDSESRSLLLARLGHVPVPAVTLPRLALHNLPYLPGDLVRRDVRLDERISVLVGMPGSGKTTLALQHARDHLTDYQSVWRIRATHLDDDLLTARPSDEAQGPSLLIYDGFDDATALKSLFPAAWSDKIIITSRSRDWPQHFDLVEVRPLSREQSIAFLDVDGGDLVAEALGDLPFALAEAKSYLRDGHSTESYLQLLRDGGMAFSSRRGRSLRDLLSGAFDRVERGNAAARQLLSAISFLGPSPIPRELLVAVAGAELDQALADLVLGSMLEVVSVGFGVHPVIGMFARETERGTTFLGSLMKRLPVPADRQGLESLRRHVVALVEHGASVAPVESANLLARVGQAWLATGAWHEARECADEAARLDPDNAEAVALQGDAFGHTVVLLGEDRAELTEQLRTAFGKERVEVVDPADPIECLVTSPYRIDCVVAVGRGMTSVLKAQVVLARSVGVPGAIGAAMPDPFADLPTALDLRADFSGATAVKVNLGEDVLELADLIHRVVRQHTILADPVASTQFRAVLMARDGDPPKSASISFDSWQCTVTVTGVLTGTAPGTVIVLFEVAESISIRVGTRFDSSLGRGVVVKVAK